MSGFIRAIWHKQDFNQWIDVLDWLFDDAKFDHDKRWKGTNLTRFTNTVKKFDGFSKETFQCALKKDSIIPDFSQNSPTMMMKSEQGMGRDIVRHIRNGIAHGNAKIIQKNGKRYIEISDYKARSRARNDKSAYIFVPVEYVLKIYKVYCDIEKSFKNGRSVKRQNKKGA